MIMHGVIIVKRKISTHQIITISQKKTACTILAVLFSRKRFFIITTDMLRKFMSISGSIVKTYELDTAGLFAIYEDRGVFFFQVVGGADEHLVDGLVGERFYENHEVFF